MGEKRTMRQTQAQCLAIVQLKIDVYILLAACVLQLHRQTYAQNKLKVSGQFNTGITGTTTKQVSHSVWKNVTVFETYAGGVLQSITMVGTGSSNNSFTNVPYPSDATRIEAVGYDGTRTLVFGAR